MNAKVSQSVSMNGNTVAGDRELFYWLRNPERYMEFLPCAKDRLRHELSKARARVLEVPDIAGGKIAIDPTVLPTLTMPPGLGSSECRELVLQFAPFALQGHCWLQGFSKASNNDTEIASTLFRLYKAGLSEPGTKSDVTAYKGLMHSAGIIVPSLDSGWDDRLNDRAFQLALVPLCLARCNEEYLAELLGYTLASISGLSVMMEPWVLQWIRGNGLANSYHTLIESRRQGMEPLGREAVQRFLVDALQHGSNQSAGERIADGIRLYVSADREFWSGFLGAVGLRPLPVEKVLDLFRKKALYGRGFHHRIRLAGKSLDDWFSGSLNENSGFLEALLQSKWFNLDDPDKSRFFESVLSPNGPMFGVFSPAELATIRDWLKSAAESPKSGCRDTGSMTVGNVRIRNHPRGADRIAATTKSPCPGKTEMFYQLVNVREHPGILPHARRYARRCLRYSKLALTLGLNRHLTFFPFEHQLFHARIEQIYRCQVDAYKPLQGRPRLDRCEWAWLIQQFAPTVLVDGCWLQNMSDPGLESSPVSGPLWKIFADEVGDGDRLCNHPLIYRRLLDSLGIALPKISERHFCIDKSFVGGAFDLPVYLLAISQFPRSFLPEIVGLNLAIELSGLGAGYRRLAESMEYWAIDATIVRLHLSIDNISSGHSAIATRVVSRYLDQVLAESGEEVMQACWSRILLGFVSLRVVPARFGGNLACNLIARRAGHYLAGMKLPA
jgi:hypothetical protein